MENHYMRTYDAGAVIIEEGRISTTMYYLESGKVGVYKDYGMPEQKLIAEITDGFFGEMGLVSDDPRSATIVTLEPSYIELISRGELADYFKEYPMMKEEILMTMCKRIRDLDREYMKVCGCINEYLKNEEAGEKQSPELIDRMKKIAKKA